MKKSRKRKLGIAGAQIEEFDETTETDKFIEESTLNIINECLQDGDSSKKAMAAKLKLENEKKADTGLKPDLLALCTVSEKEHAMITLNKNKSEIPDDLNLEGLDDGEIDGYILTEEEAVQKDRVWNQMNAEYLKLAKEREERAAREREEGKPEKKKRRARKKPIGPSTTALDAIQKVLQEKKISTKINYDILKSLTAPNDDNKEETKPEPDEKKSVVIDESHLSLPNTSRKSYVNLSNNRRSKKQHLHNFPSTSAKLDDADQIATAKDKDNGENKFFKFFLLFIVNLMLLI
jgi:transcription factor IIIB 90 kDa subunit